MQKPKVTWSNPLPGQRSLKKHFMFLHVPLMESAMINPKNLQGAYLGIPTWEEPRVQDEVVHVPWVSKEMIGRRRLQLRHRFQTCRKDGRNDHDDGKKGEYFCGFRCLRVIDDVPYSCSERFGLIWLLVFNGKIFLLIGWSVSSEQCRCSQFFYHLNDFEY